MAKGKGHRKPQSTRPRVPAVHVDHFPASVVGQIDIQTGLRIPEKKKDYERLVREMGYERV